MNYRIIYVKQAVKDCERIKNVNALYNNVKELLNLISDNPFAYPPSYEALAGEMKGAYSRRINKQHRLVYRVDENIKTIVVLRMWTHYE